MTNRFLLLLLLSMGELNAADDGGILKGSVKYDGDPPAQVMKPVSPAAVAQCQCNAVADESLVVDKATKGLKWAVIRIMDAKPKDAPPKPEKPYEIDQKGCIFSPHVVIVPPGVNLEVLNPDKVLHNVHTIPYEGENPTINNAVSGPFTYKAKWLKEPDLIEIKCDIHGWMKGFILCHDPRYCAISGADGTFEIKNVPAGKYKLNIWHESFGNYMKKETIDVEIKAGAATDLGDVKFGPKK